MLKYISESMRKLLHENPLREKLQKLKSFHKDPLWEGKLMIFDDISSKLIRAKDTLFRDAFPLSFLWLS